jgi:hypothetical protein
MTNTAIRRYAPLAALLAIQLAIITAVPSTAGKSADLSAGGYTAGGTDVDTSGDTTAGIDGALVDPATGELLDPATGAPLGGDGSNGGAATGGAAGPAAGGPAAQGDTKHCKGDRQTDIVYYAPACVPKWTGGNNGGATYQGVTADKITVVRYNAQADAAVDSILATQGLASTDPQEQQFENAIEQFLNKYYEFYGRKIDIVTFNGTCDLLPPDYSCLRQDMRTLVKDTKPFAVFWGTPLASAAFDELSRLQVVNWGGWHFDAAFSAQRAPFHYDVLMDGSRVAAMLGEYWCKRLAPYPVKFSQDPLMNGKPRKLGIITPDDPANQKVLAEFSQKVAGCNGGVVASYSYQQDIDRAQEQRKAGIAKLKSAGATVVMCICDSIAPYFMIVTEDEEQYYPENIVPGTGGMDFDLVGRLYSKGRGWQSAIGLSSLGVLTPYTANDAAKAWQAGGGSGAPPYKLAFQNYAYYEAIAGVIQMAGPNLNPGTFQQAALKFGRAAGGNGVYQSYTFGQNDRSLIDDMMEVYWSSTTRSAFDNEIGAYVPLNGAKRFGPGQQPSAPANRP